MDINGTVYDMPVGSNYSDVDQGSMICRVVVKPDTGEDMIILAVNMGDLATVTGIAEADLRAEAEAYLLEIGVSAEEIAQIQAKLGE